MQLHGRGSRLLQLQAPQRPGRIDPHDSSSRCQQYSRGTRVSGMPGAATWSSVIAHDTFSEDPRSVDACVHARCCCLLSRPDSDTHGSVARRRQPVQYYEFRNVLVRHGSIVFVSPPNVSQQPVSSPIELFPHQRIAIDYQTAATAESSALATCVPADGVVTPRISDKPSHVCLCLSTAGLMCAMA